MNVRLVMVVLCSLLLCGQLPAQEIDVQYKGILSMLSVDEAIFVNTTRLKKYSAIILSSNKNVTIETEPEIIYRESFWSRPEIVIYVSPLVKNLIIRYKDSTPLYYELPIELEVGKIYAFDVKVSKNNHFTYSSIASSDISLSDFKLNPQVLMASLNPINDNAGNACAVIRYFVNDDNFVIEPNLGVLKTIKNPGQIIQYVPAGTKRLTIRNMNFMPLSGYELPIEIESKKTYDVQVSLIESAIRRQKASPDLDTYLGLGYNGKMIFTANDNTHNFSIHCNGSWMISAPTWCRLSETDGYGNADIKVSVKTNNTGSKRIGVITIQSDGVSATINVEQKEDKDILKRNN